MTAIVDVTQNVPQTHALVIGIGAYRHLEGGLLGRMLPDTLGMGQLTGPQISARKVAHWLLAPAGKLAASLGSLELLLSEDLAGTQTHGKFTYPSGESRGVERATIDNIIKACVRWKRRCHEHEGNLAIFYCCGHGLERADHFVLAEDFGDNAEQPFDHALNVTEMLLGMMDCRAQTQCFFIDACRNVPYEFVKKYHLVARSPFNADVTTRAPHSLALWSTSHGYRAEGNADDLTFYTKALLDCLDGQGSECVDGEWIVRTGTLLSAMRELMETRDGAKAQSCEGRIVGRGRGVIHFLKEPPKVFSAASQRHEAITPRPSAHLPAEIAHAQDAPAVGLDFVSNAEYLRFVEGGMGQRPLHWSTSQPRFPGSARALPITRISWDEAVEYCDWSGGCLPNATYRVAPKDAHCAAQTTEELGEWREAGTEEQKQVFDPVTARKIGIKNRSTRPPNVGFRCAEISSCVPSKWIYFDDGTCELGTDIERFSRIANDHQLAVPLSQPILGRRVRQYTLRGFALADCCVTNEEFYLFTRSTGKPWPRHWDQKWLSSTQRPFPARLTAQPVVNVTAEDARFYCIWSRTRLPSWLEWERAVAGTDRQPYPWGVDYSAARCNSVESERGSLAAVAEYWLGDSPDGVHQLCGNVSEWVMGPQARPEIRGGSYRMHCELWGLAYVFRQPAEGFRDLDVGFRVLRD